MNRSRVRSPYRRITDPRNRRNNHKEHHVDKDKIVTVNDESVKIKEKDVSFIDKVLNIFRK